MSGLSLVEQWQGVLTQKHGYNNDGMVCCGGLVG